MLFDIFIAIGDRRIGKLEDQVRRERRVVGHEFDKITENMAVRQAVGGYIAENTNIGIFLLGPPHHLNTQE